MGKMGTVNSKMGGGTCRGYFAIFLAGCTADPFILLYPFYPFYPPSGISIKFLEMRNETESHQHYHASKGEGLPAQKHQQLCHSNWHRWLKTSGWSLQNGSQFFNTEYYSTLQVVPKPQRTQSCHGLVGHLRTRKPLRCRGSVPENQSDHDYSAIHPMRQRHHPTARLQYRTAHPWRLR